MKFFRRIHMLTDLVNEKASIQFSPRIISEALGSKIIERDSIAIAEQIKNATDANATQVTIDFSKMYEEDEKLITIVDNGEGMSLDEIKDKWLNVATNNKTFDNTQLGGKGIGRFSLFRLADEIEIETTKNGFTNIFTLKKDDLENRTTTNDIEVDIKQVKMGLGETTGTKISLRKLNNDIDLEEIALDLENLNEPFTEKHFEIKYPNTYSTTNFLDIDEAVKYAPFYVSAEIEGNKIIKYSFKCICNNKTIYENETPNQIIVPDSNDINIGKIEFEIYNYYFSPAYMKKIGIKKGYLQNHFLSAYQGISVYRNHYKIYGHGKEDWLKLAEKRVARAADNIDNKLTFGYIILDSEKSMSLEEKTNREGFLRSKIQKYFYNASNAIVNEFNKDRKNAISILNEYSNSLSDQPKTKATTEANPTQLTGNLQPSINANKTVTSPDTLSKGTPANHTKPKAETQSPSNNTKSKTEEISSSNINPSNSTSTSGSEDKTKTDSLHSSKAKSRSYQNKIGVFDEEIYTSLAPSKVKDLIDEITRINALEFSLATTFLFRSLIEIAMNEYLRKNLDNVSRFFPNYYVDPDNKIVLKFYNNRTQKDDFKDIPIRKKIEDFKKYFERHNTFDSRSLTHLTKLIYFVDDLNLSIHWGDKRVSYNDLKTHWTNTSFFLQFLCKGLN
ncbi:hypothetical protein CON24_17335 [Bacillus cereus]|nr:hypothetical protein CON24_17335 [Bacillus cereus]